MDRVYFTRVTRIGSSLGVIIPRAILRDLNFQRGDYVVFGMFDDGQFSVKRLSADEVTQLRPTKVDIS